jgi:hypothetical protein
MVLSTGIPVLRNFMFKNLQKIPFGEVQDPIPALPGHGSKIPAVLLGKIFSSRGVETAKKREQTGGRWDGQRNFTKFDYF